LQAIAEYRRIRGNVNPNAMELNYTDNDLLYAIAATTKHHGKLCATIGGLMLFGKPATLRRYFPMCRIDYIIVEGREWVPNPSNRYQSVEIIEPLLMAIPRLVSLILTDIPKAFQIGDSGLYRQEVPLLPRTVIREAIVNALMHRNYRTRQPVQIIRFSNSNFIYRSINCVDTLTASQQLRHLRDLGLLEQNGKSSATYYTLSPTILGSDLSSELFTQNSFNLVGNSIDKSLPSELMSQDGSYITDSSTDKDSNWDYLNQIPEELKQSVENLGERADIDEVSSVIVQLCQWREFSSSELATILGRNQAYLRNRYLNTLITSGELEYVRPESPSDPHQAYRASKKNK
jgi:hypothetical protein